ncbi:MAG: hypothetical protein Q8R22_11055 [Flavobacterium sp.]|uniref:hypothetical protein n=1 Tax=Flavobacterium sp. TaxID=239 RepID=UPI0027365933|nr:hypothetical protein [Flavobacterium sp.]MDP3681357.1 hypothetical protein [Flavobacterium sp.]
MKISKNLLETVLPITIGTLILVGYFFSQKLFPEPELKTCESCYPSNTVYLTYFLAITILSSLYQIIIGKWILKKNENSFALTVLNTTVFAIFFTRVFVVINLFSGKRKIEWEFFPFIFLAFLLWGLLFTALIKLYRKIFGSKLIE